MARELDLERLLRTRAHKRSVADVLGLLRTPARIEMPDGTVVLGESDGEAAHPIEVDGVAIGQVVGGEDAHVVAQLVAHLFARELEKKALANETLGRYKELTLLYDVAERLAACLDLTEVARTTMSEAQRFLDATGGAVLLLDARGEHLDVVASVGDELEGIEQVSVDHGILGQVLATGRAEVVEDVSADARYVPLSQSIRSMICAPMKSGEKTLGVLRVTHHERTLWTAGHLKLVTSLAAHAASAVDNSLLHRARLREQALKSHLERFVSPRLLQAALAGEEASMVAVAFADLRESRAAMAGEVELVGLDRHVVRVIDALLSNQATVNKLHGDMVVAVFRDPAAALAGVLDARARVASADDPLDLGFGLSAAVLERDASGRVANPDALEDEVNAAAALQAAAKGRVLVDYNVLRALDGTETRAFGTVRTPSGQREAYEVLA